MLSGLYERSLKRFAADPDERARVRRSTGEAPLPPISTPGRARGDGHVTRAVLNLHELITRN